MPAIRGLTVSVGYGSLLAITLIRNMRHLTSCLVITSPEDEHTQEVARSVPGVTLSITNAFTRHGAFFNKGLSIEEAGFDVMGRHGWTLIWDADCLFPDVLPLGQLRPDTLHGCRRRILEDPLKWTPGLDWSTCPLSRDGGPVGYFQLFDANAQALANRRPWYDVSFAHAGGGDAYFCQLWPKRVVLPFDVLHLGPRDTNWFGTDEAARQVMTAFVLRNGWRRARPNIDPSVAEAVGEIVERVDVPGYAPSGYELPFVRRAQQQERRYGASGKS